MESPLLLAREIFSLLKQSDRRLVCAESCTAGLVSATLAGVPGASQWLCGSAVVYRNATKTAWIGVPDEVLVDPQRGDVCEETAVWMAEGVLRATPEAAVAVSVTGHLGPGAPEDLDGVIYIGWAERSSSMPGEVHGSSSRWQIRAPASQGSEDVTRRVARQHEAMCFVLLWIRNTLRSSNSEFPPP